MLDMPRVRRNTMFFCLAKTRVSISAHDVLVHRGDLAAMCFRWAHGTYEELSGLTLNRWLEISPESLVMHPTSEQFDNCCAIAQAMMRWK